MSAPQEQVVSLLRSRKVIRRVVDLETFRADSARNRLAFLTSKTLSAYFFKRRTYATSALMSASESFFLKDGILPRPLLIELKRRSSETSSCHFASVRFRTPLALLISPFARPSFSWHLAHFASNVVFASLELATEVSGPA